MANPFLRVIPPELVRFFAQPYVAGDSLGRAINVAADLLKDRGLLTTLDLLAENIDSKSAVEDNIYTYFEMINAAAGDDRFDSPNVRPTISLKASSYTTDPLDHDGAAAGSRSSVFRICEHARERNVRVTVDMESSHWTDFTLDLVKDLHEAGHHDVGTVIQTRLHRSEADLDRLPAKCRVRLVIGIYPESSDVALTAKRPMKERLLSYGATLLERGHYVELATHDVEYINRFVDEVVPKVGASTDQFELQMLYGVPRGKLQATMVSRNITTRVYLPFAVGWSMAIAYLRRRLDEYPAMMFSVLKDVVRSRRSG